MKKQIFRALCLTLFAGMAFASCEKENNNANEPNADGKYTVTVVSADETMGKAYGGGQFAPGTETRIYGTPEVGYQFDRWNDGNTDNPRTITVNSNIAYTAYFKAVGDNPGGGGDNPGGGETPGDFTATLTVNGTSYTSIALVSYGMDQQGNNVISLNLLLGEGGESDPSFYLYIQPRTGVQGVDNMASCSFIENADDFVNTSRGEFPHFQTTGNCNYSINVTAFDLNAQTVTLSSSGQMLDIRRAEAGEGLNFIDYSVSIDGAWQYPSTPSEK